MTKKRSVRFYRNFGGKMYLRYSHHLTEEAAKAMVIVLHDLGYYARFEKRAEGYDVFRRTKSG